VEPKYSDEPRGDCCCTTRVLCFVMGRAEERRRRTTMRRSRKRSAAAVVRTVGRDEPYPNEANGSNLSSDQSVSAVPTTGAHKRKNRWSCSCLQKDFTAPCRSRPHRVCCCCCVCVCPTIKPKNNSRGLFSFWRWMPPARCVGDRLLTSHTLLCIVAMTFLYYRYRTYSTGHAIFFCFLMYSVQYSTILKTAVSRGTYRTIVLRTVQYADRKGHKVQYDEYRYDMRNRKANELKKGVFVFQRPLRGTARL
jgi:hypothetical protein